MAQFHLKGSDISIFKCSPSDSNKQTKLRTTALGLLPNVPSFQLSCHPEIQLFSKLSPYSSSISISWELVRCQFSGLPPLNQKLWEDPEICVVTCPQVTPMHAMIQ